MTLAIGTIFVLTFVLVLWVASVVVRLIDRAKAQHSREVMDDIIAREHLRKVQQQHAIDLGAMKTYSSPYLV